MAQERTRSLARVVVDRIRQDHGLSLLTALCSALFVVLVYLVVVIGGGAVLGRTGSPSVWLSVLATAIVATAFEPERLAIRRWLARILGQERLSPYQVLARFPSTVTGSYPAEELPARMAKVLAEGTGAARAEVWLVVHHRLELAACWPDEPSIGTASTRPGASSDAPIPAVDGLRHSLAVRERGELLGALTVVVRDGQRLSPVEERLFAGLAAQSGLMLRVAGLRAELKQQLSRLQRRTDELRRARRDLVTRQDTARQRLERNIHDGAQQEVLALLVNLRLTQTLLTRSPDRAVRLLAEQVAAAKATIQTLTALSRGLYPPLLTDAGPVAALRAAIASGPIPVQLTSTTVPRCESAVEAAVYFCCLEAVQNATKHSCGTQISIDINGLFTAGNTGQIELTVTDDGRGFDPNHPTGNGLASIRDRIESVRGTLSIDSAVGAGTTIRARIPAATVAGVPRLSGFPVDRRADSPAAVSLGAVSLGAVSLGAS